MNAVKGIVEENNTNLKEIINLIREKGPLSRVGISGLTEIPQPTVTRAIEKLVRANILKEGGLGYSTGGRRPVLLEFNENCAYAVGVELGRSSVKVALTNLSGNLLSFRIKETSLQDDVAIIVEYVRDSINEMRDETNITDEAILGVGVGMPGPLNETEDGYISPPNFYNGGNIPLRKMLNEALNFPVTIDNDANVAALAEKWFGKGIGIENFAYIFADVGVGSGLIVKNDLYRGARGEGGEIGHSTIDVFGEKCTCGSYGCLETFVSIPSILKKMERRLKLNPAENELFPNPLTFKDVIDGKNNGSREAELLMVETGKFLGVGVANLINLYAPMEVILGGKVGKADSSIKAEVKNVVQNRVIGREGKKTNIVISDLREAVVLGASALVIHHSF